MSSIYKKGRDGYYYYQAYMLDLNTGKKSKRIFHALGTKDLEEAKKKQANYDILYKKQKSSSTKKIKSSVFNSFGNSKLLLFLTFTLIVLLYHNIKNDDFLVRHVEENSELKLDPNTTEKIPQELIVIKENPHLVNNELVHDKESYSHLSSLPKYSLIVEEKFPSAYSQIKVSITVDGNPSSDQIKLICQNLKTKYSKYSSIVVSVFENSTIGISLAKSLNKNISIEKQIVSWLALYSYNSVEGEYFDDNPGSYLVTN